MNKKRWLIAAVAAVCVMIGLVWWYLATPIADRYTPSQRYERNCAMDQIIHARSDDWDAMTTVTIVQTADRDFGDGATTYAVKLYIVDEAAMLAAGRDLEQLRRMDAAEGEKARREGILVHACNATIRMEDSTEQPLRFEMEALL